MKDILSMLDALNRPRLLVRAARFGLDDYCRNRHLRRLLKTDSIPSPGQSVMRLMEMESALNERRKASEADYTVASHVDVLIALMGEARLFRATRRQVTL